MQKQAKGVATNMRNEDIAELTDCIYRVDLISANQYMGNEYTQIDNGQKTIFLFGKTLAKLNPNLEIEVGDCLKITDRKCFTIKIEKL